MLIRLHGLYEPPTFYRSPSLSRVPSRATLWGYTVEGDPRGLQAGERKWRSPHQCLEHTAATSLLSLEFQAICTSFVLAFTISQNNKGVHFTYLFFGNFPNPRGLGCARTMRYARLYPPKSQASLRGYYRGNLQTSPKNRQCFFEKFPYPNFSYT